MLRPRSRPLLVTALAGAGLLGLAAPGGASAAASPKYPKYLPECRPVVAVNVRGSGQTGPTDLRHPRHGMPQEDPARTVLTDLSSLVGADVWANVSMTDVPYAAIKVGKGGFYYTMEYDVSRKDGEGSLGLVLSALNSKCPGAQVILTGYSQGADAIGDELPRVAPDVRKKILGVVLFGDPRFNPSSRAVKGSFNPDRSGVRGSRPEFPAEVPVVSYCRSLDPVCQGPIGFRIVGGGLGGLTPTVVTEGFDVNAHLRYPEDEAHKAAQWLRARLSDRGLLGLSRPTASLTPLDVSFVIDSTGSMDDAISSVRDDVAAIRAQLASQTTSFQAALTEYRDEPDEDSAFQARLVTDLTPDADTFAAALGRLDADGGGDWAESVFAGLNQGLAVSWRAPASKAVVLVGDAPPKDPEPVTGSTLDATIRRANLLGVPVHTMVVGDDTDTQAAFSAISQRTSGTSVTVGDPGQVAQSIIATLQRNAGAPTAARTRTAARPRTAGDGGEGTGGFVGVPVRFSAASSDSPLGDTLTYAWDFGDGQTATTASPVVAHTYAAPYTGDVTLTVTDSQGRAGRAVRPVGIGAGAPAAVGPATGINVRREPGALRIRWKRPLAGAPAVYRVMNGSAVLATLSPKKDRPAYSLTLDRVPRCTRLRLRVATSDALGRTAQSVRTGSVVVRPAKRTTVRRHGRRAVRLVEGRCPKRR
ncbi:cutinase family protein [Patulibacter minatonensis]|uniref:cutinase family protein n=1 Tax=Patulibacter minatonensis TaxID=298163 RepID=UPI00047A369B|nr:cutinase family protein [Patulibacter minatonensis]